MDKTVVGLLGAISAATSLGAAQAAQPAAQSLAEVMTVESYADLLKPIPNAVALLRADEAARAQAGEVQSEGEVQLAQYHHHHHHHGWRWRRWWHHHHHHHHHHRYYHHHHHHHHYHY